MSMDNDSNFEDNEFEEYREQYQQEETPDSGEPRKPNRAFVIVIGIIGAILILAIIAGVAYVILNRGRTAALFQQQAAEINAQNTAIAMQATETLAAMQAQTQKAALPPTWTPTSVVVVATNTPAPTNTQGVNAAADGPERTATVAAFLTQVAQGTAAAANTAGPLTTSTALPNTGFADDVGLPGLLGLAAALIIIVFLARRLRLSTNS